MTTLSEKINNLIDQKVSNLSAGKSAYEIAVENGFTGTVQEWLDSLKGTGISDSGNIDGGSPETSAEDSIVITLEEI